MTSPLSTAYLRWTLLRAALARGWWLATAVYLVVVAELSAAQLLLVGVFQGLTVVVAEVPAGVIADLFGRRSALVVAHVVMGAGMAATGLVTEYPALLVTQCLWGLGWAISSGADVAWITDELDRPDRIDRVLTAQGRYDLIGVPIGIAGAGALAWTTSLSVAIVTTGVGMVALGLLAVARWPEDRRERHTAAHNVTASMSILRRGAGIARRDRVIGLVLVGTFLVNGGAEGFGRLFERHLLELGVPSSPSPVVWFALIALVAAACGALVLYAVEARIDGRGIAATVYVAACGIAATGLMLFAVAPNAESAVAASLLVSGVGLPTVRVAATIMVNRRVASDVRATVHSMLSQAENLGEVVAGVLLAAIAATRSPAVTLLASAALVATAGIVVRRAPTDGVPGHTRTGRGVSRRRPSDLEGP